MLSHAMFYGKPYSFATNPKDSIGFFAFASIAVEYLVYKRKLFIGRKSQLNRLPLRFQTLYYSF